MDTHFQPMFGEWLSLVEHLVRDQGVGGSNPLSPTIFSITYRLSPKPLHSVSTLCQHFSRVPFGGPGATGGGRHTLRCTSGSRKLIAISGGAQSGFRLHH